MDQKKGEKQKAETKKEEKPIFKPATAPIPDSVSGQLSEIMRRLRLLEERYSGLRKKTQFNEQNMLKDAKDLFDDIKMLHESISELKTELSDMNEKMVRLTEEVNTSVSKSELNVLARYVDYWQPLNFLTRKEAEKLLERK